MSGGGARGVTGLGSLSLKIHRPRVCIEDPLLAVVDHAGEDLRLHLAGPPPFAHGYAVGVVEAKLAVIRIHFDDDFGKVDCPPRLECVAGDDAQDRLHARETVTGPDVACYSVLIDGVEQVANCFSILFGERGRELLGCLPKPLLIRALPPSVAPGTATGAQQGHNRGRRQKSSLSPAATDEISSPNPCPVPGIHASGLPSLVPRVNGAPTERPSPQWCQPHLNVGILLQETKG